MWARLSCLPALLPGGTRPTIATDGLESAVPDDPAPGPAINYVRVPALISGLLLLVFLPAIANKGEPSFNRVSGLTYDGYFARWLLITAALFAISGAAYLVRGSR